ncbi:MAG TPA: D-alanyl-D-alanine endopeptidase [Aquabacterium sp.]|uniref:D-alanyl-D-alanine endopeptidase n=1 Tax=Aquabacterium sp. TaxID=1872578 RepID=UPI002E3234F3|nr:D-alanyl-D-alanine endopeptidase [Aquabacterium sp.]HEX5371173.1 D-alanyl-D-alanine endopeptidase [Aquabacterium sp.]
MSVLAVSWVAQADAATTRHKSSRTQAVTKTSAKKVKVVKIVKIKKVQRTVSKSKSRARVVAAKSSRKGASVMARASQVQAPRSGIVRAMASADDLAVPARLVPVSVHAAPPVTSTGRTIIASPSMSAASGASFGQIYGLHHTADPLDLKSSVALVMDQDTNEILLAKNSEAVLPIASLTKLMTALVVVEARLPMDETITVTQDDVDTEKNSSSRLAVGTTLTRGEALHLALMSSENRAAHALGRHYPGGLSAFVTAMNAKAQQLGMRDTHYVEPTGLSSQNQSSAKDLANLVKSASQQALIRELSTSTGYAIQRGARQIQFHNTNSLVRNPTWDIGLQKTGYIVEAGRCLVMQARMAGRKLIMVFLDSSGKYSRLGDAERVRRWIETAGRHSGPSAAMQVTSQPRS